MVVVRAARVEDDPALVRFGRRFYQTLPYQDIPYCEQSAVRWLALMRELGVVLIALSDQTAIGMAGGLFSKFIFNDAYQVGQELMWWVEPEYRGSGAGAQLLAALERAAYARGAARWSMIAIEATADRLGHLYNQAGYVPTERTYSKVPQWQPLPSPQSA
jgi:GNAT superfamily N-acetyltransferase